MIISIGEILADIFFKADSGEMTACLGGAPFNMAVSAKRTGAKVGFVGRVGADVLGSWLVSEARKYGLDRLDVQIDHCHNTSIAMVSVKDGERDFAFLRKFTADTYIEINEDIFALDPSLIHVGSLMLGVEEGKAIADKVFDIARTKGIKTSFDVNYRSDIFSSVEEAKAAYLPYIAKADIVKFSEDEIELFSGLSPEEGIKQFSDKTVCVTMGEKGSMVMHKGIFVVCPTEKIKPVDTTGAGDAFFGAFLAGIEKVGYDNLNENNLKEILAVANKKGAEATTYIGAIKL